MKPMGPSYNFHRPKLLAVKLILFVMLLLSSSALAQWSSEGVLLVDRGPLSGDMCPDGQGGLWYAQLATDPVVQQVVVQHLDSEGYRSFDLQGIPVARDSTHYLCGIQPGPDGDCIVMYSRGYLDNQEVIWDIYAQRITQQGELLWGELGLDISTHSHTYKMPMSFLGHWTLSDGAGGLWGIWRLGIGNYDAFVCGVNADGTLKCPDGDLHVGFATNNQLPCEFVDDGAGGMVVLYGTDADGYWGVRHIYAQRILADGSTLYDDALLVMDKPLGNADVYGNWHDIYLRRDPQGGYVITTPIYWQRLSDDLVPQWAIEGVEVYNTWEPTWHYRGDQSSPVILADRTVQQLCLDSRHARPRFEQLLLDGTRRHGTDWGPAAGDSTVEQYSPGPDLLSPDGESVICYYKGAIGFEDYQEFLVQRITPDGDNIWPQITVLGVDSFSYGVQEYAGFYLDDESVAYVAGSVDPARLFAFKVYIDDGSVAGDNDVASSPVTTSLPSDSPVLISNAYPNPFNSSVALTISVRDPGVYDLAVHNVLGQTIHSEAVDNRTAGEFVQTVTLPDGCASGIYFLTLQHRDGRNLSQKKVAYLR